MRSVLIVEDEFLIAMDLQNALERAGFRVVGPVGTVSSAIDLIERDQPETAVLDVNLGTEEVLPVAARLKSLGVPYVLATARTKGELSQDSLLADVLNLGKPTDLRRLLTVIRSL
jgi:DNA-binding response OmpR family regulator